MKTVEFSQRYPSDNPIWKVSNPKVVQDRLRDIYGEQKELYPSKAKGKKYMVLNEKGKRVNFGNIKYEDFTFHKDEKRRQNYLQRSYGIKGDWQDKPYSANMLSRILLWNANFT
jgi:hypothetical protein